MDYDARELELLAALEACEDESECWLLVEELERLDLCRAVDCEGFVL